ncbi:homocysteine S-methyltransferase [Clostridium saccharoperbutylacetonicum]|uniref:S-methylmethionine:homocysteine methyltransferase n=1 Tax=Clostridium saccharoperbutylacetonicum N1-4(HMT) TaxID=931276 RepID=M1MY08_9CLOT|nr:homocysteine S-methyltransferase [Clostridium saccharoperbutylacetonicum]AGF56282.1 homocysteine S-methyltransferase [Clostridium saccharoperbutylacetonicum N1-4(HMT)]NRT62975.1 homocysteine S-methyltransferase [Clostridium saccharoperbutylacetonicum]NSB26332.1 homocysteine S-methyltransferase [Clostridium saccharoperbutylacetonicum]NSB45684.1 homocysteine S-methyltransferase [Clostridium saccharoperbutylacetonicum]
MNPIENILKDFPLIILDGALATELENRGCDINDSLWSAKILAEKPEMIGKVHYDYFAAGADCAITSSYQATIDGFVQKGFSEAEAISLIKRSVQIAKKARDDFWNNSENRKNRPTPLVAGSVGPYGAYLADGSEYRGDYNITEEELISFHRPRIKLLIEEGVDILACETIPSLMEAKAIIKLLKEFPNVYCWISFSCKNELEISDGTPIAECAKSLDDYSQVAAIGLNCTAPQYVQLLITEIKNNSNKPIVVYPNSGEKYDANSKTWHGNSSSHSYCCNAKGWFEAGAKLVGGCCRTTPEDIKAIAEWSRNL